ncbi:MAG: hypothetical protein H6721_30395 [Sandaracinus sp.]|nr:hypothetical protein [Sandaracinus sp.]MCB9636440.1 hypothetical protein [Sandaracinus sp.]
MRRGITGLMLLGALACGDDDGVATDAGARDGGTTRDAAVTADAANVDAAREDAGRTGWLRDRYPGDEGLASDPAVLFFDDFEEGWGRWDAPRADTAHLFVETGDAHAGDRFLRATVTHAQLLEDEYISASPRFRFDRRVDAMYWRLHVRFVGVAPNPHHWIRVAAGTEGFSSSGLANTVPDGNEGFWFDFDANLDDTFQFYTYWHAMRSGRCNDGSATPGCEGDQGTTYYYGNVFRPPATENRFARDTWTCLEIGGDVNAVGSSDGALRAWIDDVPIGEFAEGTPVGTWLRATFHPGGCEFSACTEPVPFEGFAFRTSDEVRFKEVFLDAYYERGSWENRRDRMREMGLEVGEESTIHYDDVVVATERIGCRR